MLFGLRRMKVEIAPLAFSEDAPMGSDVVRIAQGGTALADVVGMEGSGVEAVGKIIMVHLAPTTQIWINNCFTAMEKVGMPNQNLAALRME